jgi:hypothetical protein
MSASGQKTEVAASRRDFCFAPVSGHGVRPALNAIVIMTERHVVDQHERELHT